MQMNVQNNDPSLGLAPICNRQDACQSFFSPTNLLTDSDSEILLSQMGNLTCSQIPDILKKKENGTYYCIYSAHKRETQH